MSANPTGKFLKVKEFAQRSGLSDKTIRRRIAQRQLPIVQPGGPGTTILIPADALDRLVINGDHDAEPKAVPAAARRAGPRPRWTRELEP